jgi:hypothetical protein
MFLKLRDKADTQKRIIDSITARINAASVKASQLKKASKATVVVSPSAYPISQPTHYKNLFTPLPSKPDLCPLMTPHKPKLGPVLRPSNEEVDLSFSIMEQYPRKTQPKKTSPVATSIDELVLFGQEKPKVKKSKKPKKKEDIDPLVWDDIMSSVCRDPQYRYVPGFQNFPSNSNLPDHLMSSKVATNISYEKISKETIAPTLIWDLPLVGIDPVPTPSATLQPNPPQIPETPKTLSETDRKHQGIYTHVSRSDRHLPSPDMEDSETTVLPPPPITQKQDTEGRPVIPLPPPLPVQKTEVRHCIPLPPLPSQQESRPSNIPLPPPPPPVVRSPPPAVPRPTANRRGVVEPQGERPTANRRRVVEPQEDLYTNLLARILERRAAIEDEPPTPKNNNNNDDEWQ